MPLESFQDNIRHRGIVTRFGIVSPCILTIHTMPNKGMLFGMLLDSDEE